MNALTPKPRFQVLVMSEESRLGRESIETAYALKQIIAANVRVFFYLEDRKRTLETPTDKFMLSLTTFTDELEREKARQRTYDAMARKARASHVTGGRVFGYGNVEVLGANGRRSHVARQIWGRPLNAIEAKYLLSGLANADAAAGRWRCVVARMGVDGYFYMCSTPRRRGAARSRYGPQTRHGREGN
jgi:Resolvase, N terminal domain